MNNKKLGTQFERETVAWLSEHGFWAHFITPDERGAQPFDIIASINNYPAAIDCKTSVRPIFPIVRLEDNQKLAFDKWLACGNKEALLFVKHKGTVYSVDYRLLKKKGKVHLLNGNEAVKLWKSTLETK